MIELIKEKSYNIKDQKLQLFKSSILFDIGKFKLAKFTSVVVCSKFSEFDLNIFLGISNGNIVNLKLSKQRSVNQLKKEYFLI